MAVVYLHSRVLTGEVFYVGIGRSESRAYSTYGRTKHWKHIARKGYEVRILAENITWEEACELEKELINQLGRRDLNRGTLVNLTDGGEGAFGRIWTEETLKKISQALKGRTLSEEHKQKLKLNHKGMTGKTASRETIDKIKKALTGRTLSDKHKQSLRDSHTGPKPWLRKRLLQYTRDNILVAEYESQTQAFKQTGIKGINNVLTGRSRTAGGFIWKYKV